MPNRSIRDIMQGPATDQDGNQTDDDRPQVGPASQATIHKALQQVDADEATPPKGTAAPAANSGPASPKPAGPQPGDPDNPTSDLSVGTAIQRVKQYPAKVDQAIDDASS